MYAEAIKEDRERAEAKRWASLAGEERRKETRTNARIAAFLAVAVGSYGGMS